MSFYALRAILAYTVWLCFRTLLLILPLVLVHVDADVSQLVAANNDFGWRLYDRLTQGSASTNAFFSPVSVFSSLVLTLAGARGDTRRQMVEALRYGDGNDTHQSFQGLLQVGRPNSVSLASGPGI